MSSRRRAREIVLQLLYEADMNGTREDVSVRRFIKSRLQGRKALTSFSETLYFGTLEHRDEVDKHLGRLAKGWSLSRMAVTDRNVMRMAGYEILFAETPGRVAVNEAVVLIKRYGDKNSPRFVNGILDRLLKEHESGGAALADADSLVPEPSDPAVGPSDPSDQADSASESSAAENSVAESSAVERNDAERPNSSVWPTRGSAQD